MQVDFFWGGRYCVPCGWAGLLRGLGAQRPVGRLPGGGPRFSRETGGKRARGESFSPLDSLLWFGGPCGGVSLFSAWPAALYLTPVTARPPAGRAGRGGFADEKGPSHPQSLPLGGRTVRGTVRSGPGEATINHRWAGEAGSDEGAIDWPNGAEEGEHRGDRLIFLQGKVGYRIAPSSVTFGDSFPPRGKPLGCAALPEKSVPNQGTYMGTVLAPLPEQCAPPRQNERVGTSGP